MEADSPRNVFREQGHTRAMQCGHSLYLATVGALPPRPPCLPPPLTHALLLSTQIFGPEPLQSPRAPELRFRPSELQSFLSCSRGHNEATLALNPRP